MQMQHAISTEIWTLEEILCLEDEGFEYKGNCMPERA